MLLNNLRMRNFKRFRDQEIAFQDGITGIVGNNGTGKSSIVSAILFALYGLQGTGLDGNYIISSFAGPQDVCEVRLDFLVGGNEYTVVRKFKRRTSSNLHEANLYLNQKLLATSVQKVGEEVQRVVGMGPGDFRNTIYAGQKELLALIESRAGSRKDWFMQVLGIDYLKKDSAEELKLIIDDREGTFRELDGRLRELDAEGVRERLTALRTTLAAAEEEGEKALHREKAAEEELANARNEHERLRDVHERYRRLVRDEEGLTTEIGRLRGECRETEEEIERQQRLQAELDGIAPLAGRYEDLKARTDTMAGEKIRIERLTGETNTAETQIREYNERRANIERDLSALTTDAESVADLEQDVRELQSLRDQIAAMKALQSGYDTLRDEATRMDERFVQVERRAGENRVEIKEIEEKLERLHALEEELGGYDDLLARDEVFLQARDIAREEERCLRESDTASEKMNRLESEIAGPLQQLAGMESLEDEIRSAENRKEELTARISACAERLETLREDIRKNAEHRKELLAAGPEGTCPTCHQGLGDHYEQLVGKLAEDAVNVQKALTDLESEYSRATADREGLVAALKDLYGQLTVYRQLQEQLARYQARYEESRKVVERWRVEAEEYRAEMRALGVEGYDPEAHTALRERISNLSEKRAAANTLRGECNRLTALQEERRKLIADVESHFIRKEEITAEIARLGFDPALRQRLDAEAQALEPSLKAYTEAQTRLARRPALEEDLERTLSKINALKENLQVIRDELARIGFDPERFERLNEEYTRAEAAHRRALELRVRLEEVPRLVERLESTRTRLADRETELLRIRKTIEELGFTDEAIPAAEERIGNSKKAHETAQEERYAADRQIDRLKTEIEEADKKLIRADEISREQEALHEEIERLKMTRSRIKDYTDHLLQVVRNQIKEEAGRVLSEITDGRYGTVILDDDFNVLVHDMGDDYPADRFSGGEQDDIAIALRIALSRFLAGVNRVHDATFLIFDEIFGSQDEERRGNLLRALRTQEAHFPQILLISHITEVQDEFSTTLMVEMGGDQASTIREFE